MLYFRKTKKTVFNITVINQFKSIFKSNIGENVACHVDLFCILDVVFHFFAFEHFILLLKGCEQHFSIHNFFLFW